MWPKHWAKCKWAGVFPPSSIKPCLLCPRLPANTPRCPSVSRGSCAVWRSWALPAAASRCLHALPQMLSCSPAIGQTFIPGGGMGPPCIHATWELEPGCELLLGVARGALVGTEPRDSS